jgi:hypothetical protein
LIFLEFKNTDEVFFLDLKLAIELEA